MSTTDTPAKDATEKPVATKPLDVLSIGNGAAMLRTTVVRIYRSAERLGIEPPLVINNVPHFRREDLYRIAEHLKIATRPQQ